MPRVIYKSYPLKAFTRAGTSTIIFNSYFLFEENTRFVLDLPCLRKRGFKAL
jgi:hypothetical protein